MGIMLHVRTLPAGFIAPCLPTKAHTLPSGGLWLHEIKHDGFRVIARKDGDRVQLYSRAGNDMTHRFPQIVEALGRLRSRSCIIDGEAVACDDNGLASFERIRYRQHDGDVFLYAFDLIELNGDDLRRDPLQVRKATLAYPGQGSPRYPVQRAQSGAMPPHDAPHGVHPGDHRLSSRRAGGRALTATASTFASGRLCRRASSRRNGMSGCRRA